MSKKFSAFWLTFFIFSRLAAQEASPTPASNSAPISTITTTETQFKTPLGGTFKVPKGWSVSSDNGVFILHDPDNQLTAALVETHGSDLKEAINSAWKTVLPDQSKKIMDTDQQEHESNVHVDWEKTLNVAYDLTPEATTIFSASALEKHNVCYVHLFYGSRAAADRREAQLSIIYNSLKLPGFVGELFKGMTTYNLDADRLKNLEEFIRYALDKCKVPGAAVGIVQDGRVVYEKGFGVYEKGKPAPVSPQTLFMIGSVTKPLSSLLLARLVDQRKFTWTTRVDKLFSQFRLGSPALTRELTMKDTFCGCTGIPRRDLELAFNTAKGTPEGLMGEMGKLNPSTGFEETFQYSNQMVAAGGYIAAHALYPRKTLGQAYDDAMQSQIFDPLGMKNTTLDPQIAAQRDHATPHGRNLEGAAVPLNLSVDSWLIPARPAVGIWSNVDDLTKYLLMELSNGKTSDGKVLISKKNLLKRREPEVKISEKSDYGLGLFVKDDHGFKYVGHDGSVAGFSSMMAFYPDLGIGLVILANAEHSELFSNTTRVRLFDLLFDQKSRAKDELNKGEDKLFSYYLYLNFRSYFQDGNFFKGIQGDYECDELGRVSIQVKGDKAFFVTEGWTVPVASFERKKSDPVRRIILTESPAFGTILKPDSLNGQETLTLETPQKEYVFKRILPSPAK